MILIVLLNINDLELGWILNMYEKIYCMKHLKEHEMQNLQNTYQASAEYLLKPGQW